MPEYGGSLNASSCKPSAMKCPCNTLLHLSWMTEEDVLTFERPHQSPEGWSLSKISQLRRLTIRVGSPGVKTKDGAACGFLKNTGAWTFIASSSPSLTFYTFITSVQASMREQSAPRTRVGRVLCVCAVCCCPTAVRLHV